MIKSGKLSLNTCLQTLYPNHIYFFSDSNMHLNQEHYSQA